MEKITVDTIRSAKNRQKITMLTCYDYSFAAALDSCGVDIVLVGDSLANVVLGLDQTCAVTIREMLNHTKAVRRGVKRSLVVSDMPYRSYQRPRDTSLYYAEKMIEAGAEAVKLEWFEPVRGAVPCCEVFKRLVKNGIPVMGHIGLTPQTAHLSGGYRVRGKAASEARALLRQAKQLEDTGVFSLVLECMPRRLAEYISRSLTIPTIGIGAGNGCDGQVLVLYDILGLFPGKKTKFVKQYCDLQKTLRSSIEEFNREVRQGTFPGPDHSYGMDEQEWDAFRRDPGADK